MKLGLDTSVVVRILSGEPEIMAVAAMRYLLQRTREGDQFLVSDLVLAETYHAFQHHYGASKKETLAALRDFLASPGVEATGEVAAVLATPRLESAKPGFVDRLIHRNYLASGAEHVVTFELSAGKLEQVTVITA